MNHEVRLLYQKETGLGLDTINNFADTTEISIDVICPECGEEFSDRGYTKIETELKDYIEWLENKVRDATHQGNQS